LLVWFALLAVLIVMRVLNGDIFAAEMLQAGRVRLRCCAGARAA